jgi:hypothetical protein
VKGGARVKAVEMARLSWSILLATLIASQVIAEEQDQTLKPGASGSKVVETVINRIEAACIFSEDKLFTRRLAFVESHDGQDPETYKKGYNGGIWKVNRGLEKLTTKIVILLLVRSMKTCSRRHRAPALALSYSLTSRTSNTSSESTGLRCTGLI